MGDWTDVIGGVAGAAASIYGANKQADAAKDAAQSSQQGTDASLALQKQIYDQNREDQAPWRAAGQSALGYLTNGYGTDGTNGALTRGFTTADYTSDPGYAVRMQQGQQALERSAAQRGGLYSGRAAKDLTRFAQDTASNEYQNAYNRFNTTQSNQYNRLASLAGVGQTANNSNAASGSSYANNASNAIMTNAANQGNSSQAAANATASGYSGALNSLGQIKW